MDCCFRFRFLLVCLCCVWNDVAVAVVVFLAMIFVVNNSIVVPTVSGILAANNDVMGGKILPESIHRNLIFDRRTKITMRSIILVH